VTPLPPYVYLGDTNHVGHPGFLGKAHEAYIPGQKAANLGLGAGLALAAAVFALYGLGFLFATIAAGLATAMSTWLAILIVTLGLFVIAAVLGLVGLNRIKKGTPPVPEQAIREAKLTQNALKANGD